MWYYFYTVCLVAALNLVFDVYYILWSLFSLCKACLLVGLCGGYMDLFDTMGTWGVCTPTDLDYLGHMNNARYLRNADSNRLEFVVRTGMFQAIRSRGAQMLLGSTTIRYRRALLPLETYTLNCKIICWDEKAFYFEQQYQRHKDGFVCAIAILKGALIGTSPAEIVRAIRGEDTPSPEFPEEVKLWIESNNISSQKLRKHL